MPELGDLVKIMWLSFWCAGWLSFAVFRNDFNLEITLGPSWTWHHTARRIENSNSRKPERRPNDLFCRHERFSTGQPATDSSDYFFIETNDRATFNAFISNFASRSRRRF